MKDLVMTISPLIVAGLGKLSCTYPLFTIKLLSLLLALLLAIQICLTGYRSEWADNQTLIEREISNTFLPVDSLINSNPDRKPLDRAGRYKMLVRENEKIKASINQTLSGSSDKMKRINENWDYSFYMAYAIIVSLAIFSYVFFKYKMDRSSK